MKVLSTSNQTNNTDVSENYSKVALGIGLLSIAAFAYFIGGADTDGVKIFFGRLFIILFSFSGFIYSVGGVKSTEKMLLVLNKFLLIVCSAGTVFGLSLFVF
jgi:hypothetical protein